MSDRCDPDVFAKGEGVCVFHARAIITEPWVQKVAATSGQRVDWHYSGGMVNMLYLGDYDRVRVAIEALRPELDAACVALTGHPAELFRVLPPGAHGLYRAGDPVPDGTVAIVTTTDPPMFIVDSTRKAPR